MWLCQLAQKSLSSNSHMLSHQLRHYYPSAFHQHLHPLPSVFRESSNFFFSLVFTVIHVQSVSARQRVHALASNQVNLFFFFLYTDSHPHGSHPHPTHPHPNTSARSRLPYTSISECFFFIFFLSFFTLISQPIHVHTRHICTPISTTYPSAFTIHIQDLYLVGFPFFFFSTFFFSFLHSHPCLHATQPDAHCPVTIAR